MAAGIVYHNYTTDTGVTFAVACWVPNTAAPNVGCIPAILPIKSDGTVQTKTLDDINTSLGAGAGSDGSSTITAGGTAQDLFASATPTNGFTVHNPDATEDLWISLSTTAVANGQACINIAAGGGSYTTPDFMRPFHAISIVGATTGHKFTAIKW